MKTPSATSVTTASRNRYFLTGVSTLQPKTSIVAVDTDPDGATDVVGVVITSWPAAGLGTKPTPVGGVVTFTPTATGNQTATLVVEGETAEQGGTVTLRLRDGLVREPRYSTLEQRVHLLDGEQFLRVVERHEVAQVFHQATNDTSRAWTVREYFEDIRKVFLLACAMGFEAAQCVV